MMREFEIERQYGIKIENLKPNKGVYILKTNMGTKCLKKIDYGIQKLYFVYGAKEHLINNGFTNVDRYCLNIEGNPYAIVNEDIYTLSSWIDGEECNFHEAEHIIEAAKKLALLHLASRGYEPPENSKLKTDLGRWPHLMGKRTKGLDKMKEMGRKKGRYTEFDLSYIKNLEFYKNLSKKAMNIIEDSSYLKLCQISDNDKSFCHHDYTYHNIIVDKEGDYNIIDFDYSKREIRAYDIASFMTKVLKRNDWKIEYAKLIINSYNQISEITDEEIRVIYSFLIFPQRFWRLANRYYYNEVNWSLSTFDKKLQELIDEQNKFLNFVEEFKTNFNQKD